MHYTEFIDRLFARLGEGETAEAVYTSGSSFEVTMRQGQPQFSISDTASLRFRLMKGGRMGMASTQILDEDAVDLLVEGARENAGLIESEDEQFFFEGSDHYPELKLYNPALDALTAAQKIDMAKELERLTLNQDPRVTQLEECAVFYESGETVMRNTYIAAGNHDEAEIIAGGGDGLYAQSMGGGRVNPATGEFNFAVAEGYLIRDGKIDKPVRGATLIGRGGEILKKIDRVGRKMWMALGMCGASSGSLPTNVGQPMLRVTDITVGGR